MGKPYQKWSDVKAELLQDADFAEEWLSSKPFRNVKIELRNLGLSDDQKGHRIGPD